MNPTAPTGVDRKIPGRGLDWLWFLVVVGAALALRGYDLSARPMHADEANQAVKLGQLLAGGNYVYNPADHHGPTLYYFSLVPARLRGQTTLAALTESTVRLTPALAGVAGVALLWLLLRPWGLGPATIAALFLAVSPPAVYYSRYFIQETLLVTFTLGALVAGLRWWRGGGPVWAAITGVCFGLMLATKETAMVLAATALLALVVSRRAESGSKVNWRDVGVAGGAALLVAALFFSSFGANLAGLRDALLAPWTMLGRATGGASGHEKPWWYYASLFAWQRHGGYLWDESAFWVPAVIGGIVAMRARGLARFLAIYTTVNLFILSVTPYKTPWLVINLLPGLCGLAALALARLPKNLTAVATLLVIAGLGWQTRQAVFRLPADERNPFAYVHTSPDMKKVPALAAAAPAGLIKVIGKEYWPLPWYLRGRAGTGYWTEPPENCDGALVFVDAAFADTVRSRLQGKYRESFLGLRPGFVLVVFERE